jgi:hypothetical protein
MRRRQATLVNAHFSVISAAVMQQDVRHDPASPASS